MPAHRQALTQEMSSAYDLRQAMTPEEHDNVNKAATAFVLGHSDKVQSFEPIINAVHFPMELAVFSGQSIVVKPGQPLIITGKNPQTLNYQSITVEAGGQIIVQTNADITTQTFTAH